MKFEAHKFWEILREAPRRAGEMNCQTFGMSVACVAALFGLAALPWRMFQLMPPPVWVFFGDTAVSLVFLRLGSADLIHVPEARLANGNVLPDFAGIVGDSGLWLPFAVVVTLLLIDGTESLATIVAVDKLDPFRRKSDPDRTLLAMGASNVCSGLVGGLTIIPGIVKSTANILGGGRTQWANFFNACFFLVFLAFCRDLINLVPKCVLGSILLFVGFKLCRPKVWRHVAAVGREQIVIFTATVLVTVTTDLLIGVFAGVALKLFYCALLTGSPRGILGLFRNPVARREWDGQSYRLYVGRPRVCFNLFHVYRELERVPAGATAVFLHLTDGVAVIDHTTCAYLFQFVEDCQLRGKVRVEIGGLEQLTPRSRHDTSMRVRCPADAGGGQAGSGPQPGADTGAPRNRDTAHAEGPIVNGKQATVRVNGNGGSLSPTRNEAEEALDYLSLTKTTHQR